MEEWNKVYQRNCLLDNSFLEKYKEDKFIFEKNCLELLVELGELANASKCFKYWTLKKANNEEVLEEYADCVIMTLSFFYYLKLDTLETCDVDFPNVLENFQFLFEQSSLLMHKCSKEVVVLIFSGLLKLGSFLGFKEEEIIMACYKKIDVCEERLKSDY